MRTGQLQTVEHTHWAHRNIAKTAHAPSTAHRASNQRNGCRDPRTPQLLQPNDRTGDNAHRTRSKQHNTAPIMRPNSNGHSAADGDQYNTARAPRNTIRHRARIATAQGAAQRAQRTQRITRTRDAHAEPCTRTGGQHNARMLIYTGKCVHILQRRRRCAVAACRSPKERGHHSKC